MARKWKCSILEPIQTRALREAFVVPGLNASRGPLASTTRAGHYDLTRFSVLAPMRHGCAMAMRPFGDTLIRQIALRRHTGIFYYRPSAPPAHSHSPVPIRYGGGRTPPGSKTRISGT